MRFNVRISACQGPNVCENYYGANQLQYVAVCSYSKILLDESKCWVALSVQLMLVTVGEEGWLLICSNSFSLWLSADCTLAVGL